MWWPDYLLSHSTGLNPAELNRNTQKSAAHLIGKICFRRHLFIFLLQNGILSAYFVQVVPTRAHHLELWSGKQNSARPSQKASSTSTAAFRSTRPVCTLYTPGWRFFHRSATPKTITLTKWVWRETAVTGQSWKITERAYVWWGAINRGWPAVS